MMPPKGRKHCRSLPLDILSNLPDNVIDVILMCLPCKDAARTSILSKQWKFNWCRRTKLTLDESHWRTKNDLLDPTVKFKKIIYQCLSLHEGPITKFTLDIANLESCPKIDNFIYFLSRNDIQHLVLHLPRKKLYKLPSSLFACSQLRHLTLHNCLMDHPSAYKGFDRLISLELCGVTISSELVNGLISHCPLLEQLVLRISEMCYEIEINAPMLRSLDFTGPLHLLCLKNVPHMAKVSLANEGGQVLAEDFDFAKYFESCTALEHLLLTFIDLEYIFGEEIEAPARLPYDLNHLKRFHVSGFELKESFELSYVLCFMRSSPYLEYLEIQLEESYDDVLESLELERFSDVTFIHLREVKLEYFMGTMPEMQLIKLLLDKSPLLVRMVIYLNGVYLGTRSEILAEISKFWHASPEAEVAYIS